MNMHIRKLLAVTVLLATSLSAGAAGLLDAVQHRGTLRVAMEGTYPPFNYKENGQLAGFEVELANAVAQRLGVKASSPRVNGAACWPVCRRASTTW